MRAFVLIITCNTISCIISLVCLLCVSRVRRILLALLFICSAAAGSQAQSYTAIRLTTPTGESITPRAVIDSDAGEKVRVVGEYVTGNIISGIKVHACLWTASGFLELPPLRTQASAYVINKHGQVYGADYDAEGMNPRLIGWTPTGGAFAPSPPPYTLLGAIAVNNLNAVVSNGYKTAADGSIAESGSYVLAGGGLTRLLPLPGDLSAEGHGINDNFWVVGRSSYYGPGAPVVWMGGGTPASLGSFGGSDGWAFGVNNNGQAVGYSTLSPSVDPSGAVHAFLWQNGVMSRLHEGGYSSSYAIAINDAGEIVGKADRRAVYWNNGQLTDLNRHAPAADNVEFTKAVDISSKGAIIVLGDVINSGGDPANYVLIPLDTTAIGPDLNRDGIIKPGDPSDQTSADNPFIFWTNDDVDVATRKDEVDADPNAGQRDYEDLAISCKRDLEDFERIWIRAPAVFDPANSQWSVTCALEVSSGDPGINLWAAVTDSTTYLSDTTIADQQIRIGGVSLVSGKSVAVDAKLFTYREASTGALYAPLLFEGRTPGTFALVVRFLRNGAQAAEARCHFDLRPMSAFYDHFTVGDTATMNVSQIPPVATQIQTATVRGSTTDYILFVHGWRMKPWGRRSFAETACKRLWHLGYKGGFGLYSWPTEYVDGRLPTLLKDRDPLQNYDRSEEKACHSAPGLRGVLRHLSGEGLRVHLFAHSMGNVVASEALELEGESAAPRQLVANYAATQAATVAHAYDPATPRVLRKSATKTPNVYAAYPPTQTMYYSNLKPAAGNVINLHNKEDYALGKWLTNQQWKPDAGWGYSTTLGFYRSQGGTVLLKFPQDRAEIFSFVAQAWSNALGREPLATANINVSYNLNAAPIGFGKNSSDHSGQFNSTIMQRAIYWSELLSTRALNINSN